VGCIEVFYRRKRLDRSLGYIPRKAAGFAATAMSQGAFHAFTERPMKTRLLLGIVLARVVFGNRDVFCR
jgi:hypothetical protein